MSDIKADLDYRMAYGHRAWRNVSLLEISYGVFGLRNQLFLPFLILSK